MRNKKELEPPTEYIEPVSSEKPSFEYVPIDAKQIIRQAESVGIYESERTRQLHEAIEHISQLNKWQVSDDSKSELARQVLEIEREWSKSSGYDDLPDRQKEHLTKQEYIQWNSKYREVFCGVTAASIAFEALENGVPVVKLKSWTGTNFDKLFERSRQAHQEMIQDVRKVLPSIELNTPLAEIYRIMKEKSLTGNKELLQEFATIPSELERYLLVEEAFFSRPLDKWINVVKNSPGVDSHKVDEMIDWLETTADDLKKEPQLDIQGIAKKVLSLAEEGGVEERCLFGFLNIMKQTSLIDACRGQIEQAKGSEYLFECLPLSELHLERYSPESIRILYRQVKNDPGKMLRAKMSILATCAFSKPTAEVPLELAKLFQVFRKSGK